MSSASESNIYELNEEIYKSLCQFCGGKYCKNLNIDKSWNGIFFDVIKKLFSFTSEILNGSEICINCVATIESICKFYNQVKNASQIFLRAKNSIKDDVHINSEYDAGYVGNNDFNNSNKIILETNLEFIEIKQKPFNCDENSNIYGGLDKGISNKSIKIEKGDFSEIEEDGDCNVVKSIDSISTFSLPLILEVESCSEIDRNSNTETKTKKCEEIKENQNSKLDVLTEEAKFYKCPHCSKRFPKKRSVSNHIRYQHSTKNPAVCKYCNQEFENKYALCIHKRNIKCSAKRKNECQICGKKLSHKFRLKEHLKLHWTAEEKEAYSYKCPHCSEKCVTKHGLSRHIRTTHFKEKPYECVICNISCPSEYSLRKHKINIHGIVYKTPSKCTCEICGRTLATSTRLKEHQKLHLSAEERQAVFFKCPHCEFNNPRKGTLLNHIRTQHSNQNKVLCEICGKEFANNWNLQLHRVKHLSAEERFYECETCGKKLSNYGSLRHHKKLHMAIEEKPLYKCEICDKTLSSYLSLKNHKKLHFSVEEKGTRSFKCPHCGISFSKKKAIFKHVRIEHLEEKSFSCKICNTTFATKLTLINHEKKIHLILKN